MSTARVSIICGDNGLLHALSRLTGPTKWIIWTDGMNRNSWSHFCFFLCDSSELSIGPFMRPFLISPDTVTSDASVSRGSMLFFLAFKRGQLNALQSTLFSTRKTFMNDLQNSLIFIVNPSILALENAAVTEWLAESAITTACSKFSRMQLRTKSIHRDRCRMCRDVSESLGMEVLHKLKHSVKNSGVYWNIAFSLCSVYRTLG